MAKIPPEKIAEIRDAIRLEDWVGRTVSLKKQGRRWVGLCPFHAEKSPSFGVSEDKQLYHCFGCGVGGDLFDYVQRLEGLDFIGSLRMLAHAAGIELPKDRPTSPKEREADEKKDRMFAANAVALEVFRGALEQDPAARRYLLEERGLSEATLERFELGWAPADWSYLSDRLGRAKVGLDDAVELGLLGRRATNNRPYDRLRGRVTFPIRLPSARIAGFGARRADWSTPRARSISTLRRASSTTSRRSCMGSGSPATTSERRSRPSSSRVTSTSSSSRRPGSPIPWPGVGPRSPSRTPARSLV